MSNDIKARLAKHGIDYWCDCLPRRVGSMEQLTRRLKSAEIIEREWQNLHHRRWRRHVPISDLHGFYGITTPPYGEIWIAYPKLEEHFHFILFDPNDSGLWFTMCRFVCAWDDAPRCVGWAELLIVEGRPLSETFRYEHEGMRPYLEIEDDALREKALGAGLDLAFIDMTTALTQFSRGYMHVDKPSH